MRLHCNTFGHWKDILICSMSCPYTTRCKQFQKWRKEDDNDTIMWDRILGYLRAHPNNAYELLLTPITVPNKNRERVVKKYVCTNDEDIKILDEEEITQHLLEGIMFDDIYELGRTMEVQIRLVPASKTKTKTKTKTSPSDDTDELDDVDGEEEEEAVNTKSTKENGVGRANRKKKSQAITTAN